MTTTENKDIARRYLAALNARDIDGALSLLADDYVNHAALPHANGKDSMKVIFQKMWSATPDHRMTALDLIAEEDRVVCRMTVEGTQTGAITMGHLNLPATSRSYKTEHVHIFRVQRGKITDHWAGRDDLGWLRQLGHPPFSRDEKSLTGLTTEVTR
jgi:steroid delta-isomerase-like uncharacterized protein